MSIVRLRRCRARLHDCAHDLDPPVERLRALFLRTRVLVLFRVRRGALPRISHAGAWSLACGYPRPQVSTPTSVTRRAAVAFVSK